MERLPILLCSHHTMTQTDITPPRPTFPHYHFTTIITHTNLAPSPPSQPSSSCTVYPTHALGYHLPPSSPTHDTNRSPRPTLTQARSLLPPHFSTVPPYVQLDTVAYISYHGTTTKPSWWTLAHTTRHGEVTRDRSCNRQSGSLGRWEYWSVGRLRWLVSRKR